MTSLKNGGLVSTVEPIPVLLPKSDAGLAKGMPTPPFPPLLPLLLPELFGVNGGVGFPGTGLWWKGTKEKITR